VFLGFEIKRRNVTIYLHIRKYYELIEFFQGEKNVNVRLHIRDVNAEGNDIYKPPALHET
jgi:hypothetical protein